MVGQGTWVLRPRDRRRTAYEVFIIPSQTWEDRDEVLDLGKHAERVGGPLRAVSRGGGLGGMLIRKMFPSSHPRCVSTRCLRPPCVGPHNRSSNVAMHTGTFALWFRAYCLLGAAGGTQSWCSYHESHQNRPPKSAKRASSAHRLACWRTSSFPSPGIVECRSSTRCKCIRSQIDKKHRNVVTTDTPGFVNLEIAEGTLLEAGLGRTCYQFLGQPSTEIEGCGSPRLPLTLGFATLLAVGPATYAAGNRTNLDVLIPAISWTNVHHSTLDVTRRRMVDENEVNRACPAGRRVLNRSIEHK